MPKRGKQHKHGKEPAVSVTVPHKIVELPVVRVDPYRAEMNRFLGELEDEFALRRANPWIPQSAFITVSEPKMDLIDAGKEFVLHADMPGVPRENIKINLTATRLEILGHFGRLREPAEDAGGAQYLRQERTEAQFYRATTLPEDVVPEKARANISDGVLEIRLPKREPGARLARPAVSGQAKTAKRKRPAKKARM